MRRIFPLLLVAFFVAAPALGWVGPEKRSGNLDSDGNEEVARAVRVDLKGVATMFDHTRVVVSDVCDGKKVTRRVAGPQDNLIKMRLKRADTRPGREVFVDMRSGARALLGETRLVAWRDCKPRNVFRYDTEHTTGAPKGATDDVGSFAVSVRNLKSRYKGLEVVLDERYLGKKDPPCCGSYKKLTYWRYKRSADKYVRYATRTQRQKITPP